ncbi:hypothetical protein IF1G_02244 [Cordyceps javanica]|uniref:Uncharacterized protein n=1 Tax=Cordyceps javanica TaxID=43265 RepID=A0A545VEG1_9HYPO|nr:hypothetical protein IF1G_02244 [Cordyceps javanica]
MHRDATRVNKSPYGPPPLDELGSWAAGQLGNRGKSGRPCCFPRLPRGLAARRYPVYSIKRQVLRNKSNPLGQCCLPVFSSAFRSISSLFVKFPSLLVLPREKRVSGNETRKYRANSLGSGPVAVRRWYLAKEGALISLSA